MSLWANDAKTRSVQLHRRSKERMLAGIFILALLLALTQCERKDRHEVLLYDAYGRQLDSLDIGQTLFVGVKRIGQRQTVRIALRDEKTEQLLSYCQLTSNDKGEIPPAALWYHSGVIDERTFRTRKRFPFEFGTFEEADSVLANHQLVVSIESPDGKVIGRSPLPVNRLTTRTTPLVYFSTRDGLLRNSFVVNKDLEFFATLRLPQAVDSVQVFLVPASRGWRKGMALSEVRTEYRRRPQVVQIKEPDEAVTISLGRVDSVMLGPFDLVVRLNPSEDSTILRTDLMTYAWDIGILFQLVFDPPWTPGDFDIAGRPDKAGGYPYFEFHDVFEEGETMWGAVDPAMLPASHPEGRYAAYYVIPHGSAGSGLSDITGAREIVPIKTGCINANMTKIWDPTDAMGEYDVVLDFGSSEAMAEGDWQEDNTFNSGVDFIDRSSSVGAYVVADPSVDGPFTPIAHSYAPATTSASDPLRTDVSSYFNSPYWSVTETMDKAPLEAVGYYPDGAGPFPLMLIVHGNHNPGHPSHDGYDYLCRLLASHGIIAMSVNENFLNGGVGEMDARAIILLRHLQRFRDWNSTTGHTFHNKVNMTMIGLSGHSRGGEAVAIANEFNSSLHNTTDPDHNFGFDIISLYAIAPTDGRIVSDQNPQTGVYYPQVINETAHYFIMQGSHDGDVKRFSGQRMYDRSFPNHSAPGGFKGVLFVYRANHAFWNTEWTPHPDASVVSPVGLMLPAEQRAIGKVYISAFFRLTLLDETPYVALMTGDVDFSSLPSGITLIHQYSDESRKDINNYEEDGVWTTSTFGTATNSHTGLHSFSEEDISGQMTSTYHCFAETRAVVLGWNGGGSYKVTFDAPLGALVNTYPYLSMRIGQTYEVPETDTDLGTLNPAGADQNLSVVLMFGTDPAHTLKVSNFDDLPAPVTVGQGGTDYSKTVLKTVRIPLRSFVVNRADWNLSDVSEIRIQFDATSTGRVVIDDMQLTK